MAIERKSYAHISCCVRKWLDVWCKFILSKQKFRKKSFIRFDDGFFNFNQFTHLLSNQTVQNKTKVFNYKNSAKFSVWTWKYAFGFCIKGQADVEVITVLFSLPIDRAISIQITMKFQLLAILLMAVFAMAMGIFTFWIYANFYFTFDFSWICIHLYRFGRLLFVPRSVDGCT